MTNTKHTPTSRAQKRLDYWKDILEKRKISHLPLKMKSGSIAVDISGNETPDLEFIKSAEDAVKDWESIVRAVNSHEELLEASKNLLSGLDPDGIAVKAYSKQIEKLWEAIAQAEGK